LSKVGETTWPNVDIRASQTDLHFLVLSILPARRTILSFEHSPLLMAFCSFSSGFSHPITLMKPFSCRCSKLLISLASLIHL